MDFEVRNLKREEIPEVKRLVDTTVWNLSQEDILDCFDIYPSGFYGAVTKDGDVLSIVNMTPVGDDFVMVAFYITRPDLRGKGIGRQVFDKAFSLTENKIICLNAVEGKQEMYASSGFKYTSFIVVGNNIMSPHQSLLDHNTITLSNTKILPAQDVEFQMIADYDKTIHLIPRQKYLRAWLFNNISLTFVAVTGEKVSGLICRRPGNIGYRVMPFYADTPDIATVLWDALMESTPTGSTLRVGFPEDNEDALTLFVQEVWHEPRYS